MRFARTTIWVLMVIIAAIALILGGVRMRQRALEYGERTRFYSIREMRFRESLEKVEEILPPERDHSNGRRTLIMLENGVCVHSPSYVKREVEWYSFMAKKYARASARPWEPVAPDPPYPK